MVNSSTRQNEMVKMLSTVVSEAGYEGDVRIALISLSGDANEVTEPFLIFSAPKNPAERRAQTIIEERFNLHNF